MKIYNLLPLIICLWTVTVSSAQSPSIAVGQEHSLSDTIIIPVSLCNLEAVNAISLTLNFDNNNFSFIDLLTETDGIGQEIFTNIENNQLKIGWFSLNPVSFEKDTLVSLRFLRINGCFTFLEWDLETSGANQISTLTEPDLAVNYIDGIASFLITDQPSVIFPSNEAEVNPFNIDFSWNSAKCSKAYRVQISQQTDFSILEIDTFVTDIQLLVAALSPLTTYYWRVAKEDTQGELFWSDSARFHTRASVVTTASLAGQSNVSEAFDIPIVVKNRGMMDSFAITVNYQVTDVNFLGFQSKGLTDFTLSNNAGQLQFIWRGDADDWQNDTLCILQFQKLSQNATICSSTLSWDENSQFFQARTMQPASFNGMALTFEDGAPILDCPSNIQLRSDGLVIRDESNFIQAISLDNCENLVLQFKELPVQQDCDLLEIRQNFEGDLVLPVQTAISLIEYEAVDKAGNSTQCQLQVTIEPLNVIVSVDNPNPCQGESINLSAITPKNSSIEWFNPNNQLLTEENVFTFEPTIEGQYRMQTTLANGCIILDSLTITFPPKPSVTLSYESTDCQATNTQIQLFANQTETLDNAFWEDSRGNSISEIAPVIDSLPTNFDNLYFFNYQKEGCTYRDSIQVKIENSLPIPTLSLSKTSVCLGEELFITTQVFNTASANYFWELIDENENTIPLENQAQHTWQPNQAGAFQLRHSYAINNCQSDTLIRTISVVAPPILNPIVEGNLTCVDGTSSIQLISNIDNAANWKWQGLNTNYFSEEANPIIENVTIDQSDIYELTVITEEGCEVDALVAVEIQEGLAVPTIQLIGGICPNEPRQLQTQLLPNTIYQWLDSSDFLLSTNAFLNLGNEDGGKFLLKVQKNDCEQTTSIEVPASQALQLKNDVFDISIDQPETINIIENDALGQNALFTLELLSIPIHGSLNEIGQGQYKYNPSSAFPESDAFAYSICYNDCPTVCDETVVRLNLLYPEDQCIVTNVISPNDDGINDALFISCLDRNEFPASKLIIYNQWGKVLYQASPYLNDWQGTTEGKQIADGTYYYVFYRDENSPVQKGHFMIYR